MKTTRVLQRLTILWLLGSIAFCTTGRCQQPATTDDWAADVRFLADELARRHPDPFTRCSRERFNSEAQRLIERIDEVPAEMRILELMRLVALLGDGHTAVRPDLSRFHYYPFNARMLDDGIFVTFATKEHEQILGARLVQIGTKPIDQVVQSIKELLAHDNEFGFRNLLDKQLNTAEYLQYAGAAADLRSATFKFEKDGKQFSVSMSAAEPSQHKWIHAFKKIPIHKYREGLPFWNDFLKESGTFYFKYNACRDPEGFNRLVQGSRGFIQQTPVERFVLDLRDNGGGNSAIFKPLFDYRSNHPQLNQRGKLFVIIGRGTFSSGLFAAYDMKKTNAILVGEPTGGKPNHFGEIKSIELPKTGVQVQHSTKYWQFLKDSDPPSLEPEIRVMTGSDDFFSGTDPALEAIFKFGNQ